MDPEDQSGGVQRICWHHSVVPLLEHFGVYKAQVEPLADCTIANHGREYLILLIMEATQKAVRVSHTVHYLTLTSISNTPDLLDLPVSIELWQTFA